MDKALQLMWALPAWFFGSVADPWGARWLSAGAAFGAVCLAVGLVVGVVQRRRGLLLFIIPAVGSELFVAGVGLSGGQTADAVEIGFLLIELAIIGYLAFRLRASAWATGLLSVFCAAYALAAVVVAVLTNFFTRP